MGVPESKQFVYIDTFYKSVSGNKYVVDSSLRPLVIQTNNVAQFIKLPSNKGDKINFYILAYVVSGNIVQYIVTEDTVNSICGCLS